MRTRRAIACLVVRRESKGKDSALWLRCAKAGEIVMRLRQCWASAARRSGVVCASLKCRQWRQASSPQPPRRRRWRQPDAPPPAKGCCRVLLQQILHTVALFEQFVQGEVHALTREGIDFQASHTRVLAVLRRDGHAVDDALGDAI